MQLACTKKEVWLGRAVRRIKHCHAIDDKRIPVIVRSKRIRCAAPNALIVFQHRQWFARTLDLHAHFFSIWRAKPERYPMIGMYLRGNDRGRWCLALACLRLLFL